MLKDKDGLYKPIVPIMLMIGTILYVLFCIFIAFPLIDKLAAQ